MHLAAVLGATRNPASTTYIFLPPRPPKNENMVKDVHKRYAAAKSDNYYDPPPRPKKYIKLLNIAYINV
jgi:hypothetical protein